MVVVFAGRRHATPPYARRVHPNPSRGIAVVTGSLDASTVLSGVRALAGAGWQVHAVGAGDARVLRRSRALMALHTAPAPAEDAPGYVRAVRALLQRLDRPVLIAAGDAELITLAGARDELLAAGGVQELAALKRLLNKGLLAGASAAVGLATPDLANPDDLPVIVKSALHFEPGRRTERWEAQVATDAAELAEALQRADEAGVPVVVQRWVAGRLMALSLVLDRAGGVVGRAQQIATVTWPRDAGRSARAETVPVDDGLAAACAALLTGAGWYGLAQLQFLQPASGPAVLIDVNPRLYGSVGLAVAAGAPLPDLAARVLRGERVVSVPDARPGVQYRWLEGELRAALGGPSRLRDLRAALRPARGQIGPVWDPHDRRPAAAMVRALAGRAVRRR